MEHQADKTVLISLTTRKSIHARVVHWLLQQSNNNPIDIVDTTMPLEHARNLQVERFLQSQCDYLFIVDSDCVPKPDTIEVLLQLDLPFVSAPHPSVIGKEVGVMIVDRVENGYVQHIPFDKGLQKCDAVGCAGMFIHREVFDKLEKPYFKFVYNNDGQLIQGEDFYFCEKLQRAGIDVYAYCDMTQTHYVEVPV